MACALYSKWILVEFELFPQAFRVRNCATNSFFSDDSLLSVHLCVLPCQGSEHFRLDVDVLMDWGHYRHKRVTQDLPCLVKASGWPFDPTHNRFCPYNQIRGGRAAVGTEDVVCWVKWSVHGQQGLFSCPRWSLLCVAGLTSLNTEGQRGWESRFIQMHCDCAGYFGSLQYLFPPARHGHVRSWFTFGHASTREKRLWNSP